MEFTDHYEHLNPAVAYILENAVSPEVAVDYEIPGCNCHDDCILADNCTCVARSGSVYDFVDKTNLNSYKLRTVNLDKPAYECNNNCVCGPHKCGHKLTQFGPRPQLDVIETNGRGLGLKTAIQIERFNFVCEYIGEVITHKEARRRFQQYGNQPNYIFCISETFGARNYKTFIDPTHKGNIGRYINHSCDPNCILVPIRVRDIVPRLCIFAKCDIQPDAELTYDYAQNCADSSPPSVTQKNRKPCLCGASICRKFLPYDCTL